jgi:hypothetical protein
MKRVILLTLALPFLFTCKSVYAYDTDTHAYLSDEAIKFYNNNFPKNYFPLEFSNYVLDGARREDDVPRWMNHFYDPVHNQGLTDAFIGSWEKSKDWADDGGNQNDAKYKVPALIASILSAVEKGKINEISSETDFTWNQALQFYVAGEKEKAFFMLGHAMHLVEDSGVPDHTRNDPHPGDSPYENWTAQFNLNNKDSGLPARLAGKAFVKAGNLDSYFDGLAKYSNNNFYSKDTIGMGHGFQSPNLDYVERNGKYFYAFKQSNEGNYPLFIYKRYANNLISSEYDVGIKIDDEEYVVSNYWSHLSTKTVQYTAGVIDLFLKEAEAAKNNPALIKKPESKSFFASIAAGAQSIISYVSGAVQETFSAFESAVKNNKSEPVPTATMNTSSPQATLTKIEQPEPETEIQEDQSPDEAGVISGRIDDLTERAADLESKILAKKSKKSVIQNQSQTQSSPVSTPAPVQPAPPASTQTYTPPVTVVQPAPVYYYYYYNQPNNNSSTSTSSSTNTSTSTATSTSSVTLEISRNSNFSNIIFISEYLFHGTGAGGDTGREFVELYNSGSQSLNLSGWSLKYARSDSTSTESLALFGGTDSTDKTTVPAKGYLLVGLNNYDAANYSDTSADIVRTTSLPNVSGSSEGIAVAILLFDGEEKNVDGAAYTNKSISKAGQSLERKAKMDSGGCVSALSGGGEFMGNACGTGAGDDFEVRSDPKPQNSNSLPEPRIPPAISNAGLDFSLSAMNLVFKWDESRDSTGDALSINYEIRYVSSSDIFATTTGAIGLSKRIDEVGKNYDFLLRAFDRDGFGSAPVNLSIYVPSFFSNLYFYKDTRSSGAGNVIDAYYNQYPFVPGAKDGWKIVLFYVNSEAPKDSDLSEINGFLPVDSSTLMTLNYSRCSMSTSPGRQVIFPDSGSQCSMLGGGLLPQAMAGLEDLHFIVPASAPSGVTDFGPSSYVTAAFYDFSGRVGGYANFHLVAVDKQRYHFQPNPPASQSPDSPPDLTVQFDSLHSILSLNWSKASDSDTLDSNLSYEINYSSSTEFSAEAWQKVGKVLSASVPVVFGNGYRIGVRAVDDFGNISQSAVKDWSFPADFSPFPYQRDASQIIGISNGAGQRVFIQFGSSASKVGMVVGNAGGIYSVTDTYIGIYSDNGGSKGSMIATTTDVFQQWPMEDHPSSRGLEFNFTNPVYLNSGSYYWLVPMNGPGNSNQNYIFGSATDTYPDGYWSENAGKDASFYIH